MAENDKDRDPEKLSVQLNEAFERLEQRQRDDEDDVESVRRRNGGDAGSRDSVGSRDDSSDGSRGRQRSNSTAERSQTIEDRNSSSPASLVSMLFAFVAIAIAAWAAYMVFVEMRSDGPDPAIAELTNRLQTIEQRFGGQSEALADVRARLDTVSADLAALDTVGDDALVALENRVEESIAAVKDQVGTSSEDWLLAEVEYLLRLGNQRVVMEQDASGALALFRAADEIVRDAEGITAFDLRRAIANDIARLEGVERIDVDGIFVRLGALINQIENLQQRRYEYIPPEVPDTGDIAAQSRIGARMLALVERAGARLASLVDYRTESERVRPVLPPREEYYLRQNLVLKLQMAQLALLEADQSIYTNSLNEAREWVERYFDPDRATTQAMQEGLAELAGMNVEKEMPDVSDSLREVRKLLAGFRDAPARETGN